MMDELTRRTASAWTCPTQDAGRTAALPLLSALDDRAFTWLGNFRRLVVRYERLALNYLGFVHLGCILIVLRQGI